MNQENFHERMERLLLMSPLYQLQRRRKLAMEDGSEITGMELGMMTLLFFFEGMLSGKRRATVKILAQYLQEQLPNCQGYEYDDFVKLAREIITTFRPASGKRFQEEFFNPETGTMETVQYTYLKADLADIEANEQYYVLDEQGLELVFITKEYFSEYQLSINQLILRKQLERGQFVLALRQVEEMRLNVETIKQNIIKLRGEIHRNIVSDSTMERYSKVVKDINERLKGEEEEFKALKKFVRETRQRMVDNGDISTNIKVYDNIMEVEKRLDMVHGSHTKLLVMGIELGTAALKEAQEALFFTSLDRLNFEQEIAGKFFGTPLPVEASRQLINPFMEMEQAELWSPVAIYQPQRLERLEREQVQDVMPEEAHEEGENQKIHALQQFNQKIGSLLVKFLDNREEALLKDFFSYVAVVDPDLLERKQFFILWILLHRLGRLVPDGDNIGDKSPYYDFVKENPEIANIEVKETEDGEILEYGSFKISNMWIKVGYKDAE